MEELDLRKQVTNEQGSKIVVIIPTLNEASGIATVINNVKEAFEGFNYEILVVDGRSTDDTVNIAKSCGARVIYQRRKGYGNALLAGCIYGVEKLASDILVTIDADGSYDPHDCPKLIRKILSHESDYVVGRRRRNAKSMSVSHRFGNWLISWLVRRLLHVQISDTQSGLFAFRSELIDNVDIRASGWAVNTEMLKRAAELNMVIDEVEVSYSERIGRTKLNTFNAGLTNILVILQMMRDTEPLLLLGIVGLLFLIAGGAIGSYVIAAWLSVGTLTNTGLALLSALLVVTGVQLISLGLIADMMKKRQRQSLRLLHNYYIE